jgi:hypothetical protein
MPGRPGLGKLRVRELFCTATELKYIRTFRTRGKLVNGQMQVSGDQWPVLLYANYAYNPEDPWNGLLRSGLLVSVSPVTFCSNGV